ncbi:MAG: signal peptidase I [Oscillospiraceae bacterium]|jgi:signal peptidase I|nr:signal peptidase I [Oscillospiraceae bacterium]
MEESTEAEAMAMADALDQPSSKMTASFYELAEVMVSAILVMAAMFIFLFRFAGVVGESMLPNLHNADWLAVSAVLPKPQRGDVVIISQPNEHHEPLVKRVIATAGETIDIREGAVWINGERLDESAYLADSVVTNPAPRESASGDFPIRIPRGYVFVMGDNRGASSDSRFSDVGLINENYILGKVSLRLRPFGQFKVK